MYKLSELGRKAMILSRYAQCGCRSFDIALVGIQMPENIDLPPTYFYRCNHCQDTYSSQAALTLADAEVLSIAAELQAAQERKSQERRNTLAS